MLLVTTNGIANIIMYESLKSKSKESCTLKKQVSDELNAKENIMADTHHRKSQVPLSQVI